MKNERHIDDCESRWSISQPTKSDPTLIVCPKCSGKSFIVPSTENNLKAVCSSCSFSVEKSDNNCQFFWHDENPTDGYFGFNLWLQIDCGGNSLWAFNLRHLEILESFVGAKLRQRKSDENWGWQNSSLTSRLPKWMKNRKNREEIIKSLRKLREMA